MIRSFYGLTQNPFDLRELELLPQQQEIHDTLKVHCQQGGLCLVLGVPGTGKSVIKQSLQRLPENQHLVATVGRTLHTYTNTVKILCDAFRVEFESSAFKCERRLIEQAFSLNHAGKVPDHHPRRRPPHGPGQPAQAAAALRGLPQKPQPRPHRPAQPARRPRPRRQPGHQEPRHLLGHHQTPGPDAMRDFILRELDRAGLGHNTFTQPAVDLIVRSADGVLRKARNLCVGCLIEAVRSANKTIDIDNVNRVLMQPHWQKEADLVDY
jgi:MSHA biogenesis protein MshM